MSPLLLSVPGAPCPRFLDFISLLSKLKWISHADSVLESYVSMQAYAEPPTTHHHEGIVRHTANRYRTERNFYICAFALVLTVYANIIIIIMKTLFIPEDAVDSL